VLIEHVRRGCPVRGCGSGGTSEGRAWRANLPDRSAGWNCRTSPGYVKRTATVSASKATARTTCHQALGGSKPTSGWQDTP
jgi:hypothetical protein